MSDCRDLLCAAPTPSHEVREVGPAARCAREFGAKTRASCFFLQHMRRMERMSRIIVIGKPMRRCPVSIEPAANDPPHPVFSASCLVPYHVLHHAHLAPEQRRSPPSPF